MQLNSHAKLHGYRLCGTMPENVQTRAMSQGDLANLSRAMTTCHCSNFRNLHVYHWQEHDYNFGNITAAASKPKV